MQKGETFQCTVDELNLFEHSEDEDNDFTVKHADYYDDHNYDWSSFEGNASIMVAPKKKSPSQRSLDSASVSAEVMADGPWQIRNPRVRRPYTKNFEQEKKGWGLITREESLWMILISLSFTRNRTVLVENHDVVNYILHFFILWTVLYSCILYSARFNDRDFFHSVFWNLVLMSLMFLASSIDEGARTMAWAGCAAHLLLAVANARVAVYLPEARAYTSWVAFQCVLNAAVMACLAFVSINSMAYQGLLWSNVFLQPLLFSFYKFIIWLLDCQYPDYAPGAAGCTGYGASLHVTADFSYVFARWQGVHMLATLGGFISAIALFAAGAIRISVDSRIIAVCAFIFALAFKHSILDVDVVSMKEADSKRHPYRRFHITQRIFLLLFPYSVLCVALTGMGYFLMTLDAAGLAPFVPGSDTQAFSRKLTSISATCAWLVFSTNKLLTKPRSRFEEIHWLKVTVLYTLSFCFLVPALLEFTLVWSAVWVTTVQLFILSSMLIAMLLERNMREFYREQNRFTGSPLSDSLQRVPSEYGTWAFKNPELLQDWDELDEQIGTKMDNHELFSTVLMGVSLEEISMQIQDTNSISPIYGLCFVTMYGAFAMLMRYSSRFSLKDLSHRLGWSGFQFLMLLQIVGMRSETKTLFAAASAIQYCLVAFAFWFRIAWQHPRCRPYAAYCLCVCLLLAAISSLRCFTSSDAIVWPVLIGVSFFGLFSEPLFNIGTWCLLHEDERQEVLLPMNVEYLHNRMNGTFITVISVCVLKGGVVIFWGSTHHPGLAAVCVVCVGIIAICILSSLFHTDMVSAKRHAVRRGESYCMLYLFLHPCLLISMSLVGGMMLMIMTNVGNYGWMACNSLAKHVFCTSAAAFIFLVTCSNSLHEAKKKKKEGNVMNLAGVAGKHPRRLRAGNSMIMCLLCLLPLFIRPMCDLESLIYIAAMMYADRYLQVFVNFEFANAEAHLAKFMAQDKAQDADEEKGACSEKPLVRSFTKALL